MRTWFAEIIRALCWRIAGYLVQLARAMTAAEQGRSKTYYFKFLCLLARLRRKKIGHSLQLKQFG